MKSFKRMLAVFLVVVILSATLLNAFASDSLGEINETYDIVSESSEYPQIPIDYEEITVSDEIDEDNFENNIKIYGLTLSPDCSFLLPGDTVELMVGFVTEPPESTINLENELIEETTTVSHEEIVDIQEESSTVISSIGNSEEISEQSSYSVDVSTTVAEYVDKDLSEISVSDYEADNITSDDISEIIEESSNLNSESTSEIEFIENTDGSNLIWSSSNESVAVVDFNGLVEAKEIGTAIITVSTNDNKFSTSCEINVVEELPDSINSSNSAMLLSSSYQVALSPNTSWSDKPRHWAVKISSDYTVNFDVYKCDSSGVYIGSEGDISSQVTWQSSDTSVATVDVYGCVTGHKNGSTTITVTAKNGNTVTVYNPIHVTVYTAYSSTHSGVAKAWVSQYKSTQADCHTDRQVGVVSPGTLLNLYGSSGGYVLASISGQTSKYFLWANNLYDKTNGTITICKSGTTTDTRRHWDMYTTQTLKLALTNGASATWTTSDSSIAKVNSAASATGTVITINPVAEGTAYITANSDGKIDLIHLTVITRYSSTKMGITIRTCSKYKCSHTQCTIIDRKEGDTEPNKLIRIYGESGGFYYTNVVGENTYRYMWKNNIQLQSWYRRCELENTNVTDGRYATQGFAVDTNYCYSFEIRGTSGAEEYHRLYRYDINTGERIRMTQTGDVGYLWHANDATIVRFTENGVSVPYIFVVAFSSSKTNYLVKLGFNSAGQYWEEARYTVPSSIRIAGIALISGGGVNPAVFVLKSGNKFYEATISNDKVSGSYVWDVAPSTKFTLGGDKVPDDTAQGIHYETSTDKLYLAYSGIKDDDGNADNSKNEVYMYSNVKNASGSLEYSASWNIKKDAASVLYYELEGIGFRPNSTDERLWFLTFEGDSRNGGIYTDLQSIR